MTDFDIDHLQNLAYLDLDPEQKEKLKAQVGRILKHVENLSEVDTQGISPSFTMLKQGTPLRPDEQSSFANVDGIIANAPQPEAHAFRVPRIMA